MNAQQFSSGDVAFTYVASAMVSSVWPERGAAEGGTPITVSGANLLAASEQLGYLHCSFNGTLVRAARLDDEAVVCNSSAAEGDRGPNGEDCSWTGAVCADGWEGVVSLSCGTPPASAPFPAPAPSVAGVPTAVQLLCRLQRDDQRDDSW